MKFSWFQSRRSGAALILVVVASATFLCAWAEAASAGDWRPLFNGDDLENWTQNGSAKWIVKDGIIVGGQGGDPKRAGLLPDGH